MEQNFQLLFPQVKAKLGESPQVGRKVQGCGETSCEDIFPVSNVKIVNITLIGTGRIK